MEGLTHCTSSWVMEKYLGPEDAARKEESDSMFMTLPLEMKIKVFEELPLETLKKCRLVCSAWCDIINTNHLYSLVINDQKFDYTNCQFPPWKVEKCVIVSLAEDLTFIHSPEKLRKLFFWGDIPRTNFQRLLTQATHLEELSLANEVFCQDLWTGCEALKLNHLRKLVVFFTTFDIFKVAMADNLVGLFSLEMPNLVSLKVTIIGESPRRNVFRYVQKELHFAKVFLTFLCRLRKLKVLQLEMSPYLKVSDEVARELMQELDHLCQIKLHLHVCRLVVSPFYFKILKPVMLETQVLKDFRCQMPFSASFTGPFSIFQRVLKLSRVTLEAVNLHWCFGMQTINTFDFGMFASMQCLKRLIFKSALKELILPSIQHLERLPASLEHLDIEGFECRSAELKSMLDILTRLKYLRLIRVGSISGFGIDGSVAKKIVFGSIDSIRIGPMSCLVPGVEDEEFEFLRESFKLDSFVCGKIVTLDLAKFRQKAEKNV